MRRLRAWLHGRHVADIDEVDRRLSLAYTADGAALSLSMPVVDRRHGHQRVSAWLAGLLPDDERVLVRWARTEQVGATPVALLSTRIGLDCAGAVQFTTGDDDLPTTRASGVTWLDEREQLELVTKLHADRTAWGRTAAGGRFSLAGAQTKVALRVQDGRVGVPYGDEPSNVIVKPSIAGLAGQAINEAVCLDAISRIGLDAAPTKLWQVGRHQLVMSARYDRRHDDSGALRRLHQEDLCQAMGLPPTSRYQADGGPGPRDVVDLLARHQSAARLRIDRARFAEALVVNWLLAATDAHAKNYSMLLDGPAPRLAPLYDIASFAPYDDVAGAKLAMKFGGEYRFKAIAPRRSIARIATELGVDGPWLLTRAGDLAAALPDALRDAFVAADVLDDAEASSTMVDVVIHHVERCARALAPPPTGRATAP